MGRQTSDQSQLF